MSRAAAPQRERVTIPPCSHDQREQAAAAVRKLSTHVGLEAHRKVGAFKFFVDGLLRGEEMHDLEAMALAYALRAPVALPEPTELAPVEEEQPLSQLPWYGQP